MVAPTRNSSTQEAEAERLQIEGLPQLHSKLFLKTRQGKLFSWPSTCLVSMRN